MMGCTMLTRYVSMFVMCIVVDLLQAYMDKGKSGYLVCKYDLVVSCSLLSKILHLLLNETE